MAKNKSHSVIYLLVLILLLLIGVVIIAFSQSGSILRSIGISVMTSGMLSLVLKFTSGVADAERISEILESNLERQFGRVLDNNAIEKKCSEFGIKDVFISRLSSFKENPQYGDWGRLISHRAENNGHEREINIMGITLDGIFRFDRLADDFDAEKIKSLQDVASMPRIVALIDRMRDGATVNIVIPAKDCEYLKLRATTEKVQNPEKRWATRLTLNENILRRLLTLDEVKGLKGTLRIHHYRNIMYYYLLQSDDLMFITQYLGYRTGDDCPSIVIDRTANHGLFSHYHEDFMSIIGDAHNSD